MKQTKFVNLPVIGRIQHGEKINNRLIERGYFLAKINNDYMQTYLQKFEQQYNKKQSIEIELFNEEPLTTQYARYNQSGKVCYCMTDLDQANQKTKEGWQKINCDTYNCQFRQKNEQGKCSCNRIGWLKFLIPSVCKDRIFLMKISSQTSINRLNDYFNLQKAQGNSIRGIYTLYLKQEEQSNSLGKTFNNYILDILKKENFESIKQIPEKTRELCTNNDKNVNNVVVNSNTPPSTQKITQTQKNIEIPKEEIVTKPTTKKESKSKSKKTDTKPKDTKAQDSSSEDDNLKNCYSLLSTFNEKIEGKHYLIGEFADMKDQISNIAIRPEDATELEKCDLGTFVRLEVSEIRGRKFAVKLEFIQKTLKKVAA